jgi:uncharacterized protein
MESTMADATASPASASSNAKAVPRGRPVWYDLMSTDPQGSKDFYTKLVGWTTQPHEYSPEQYDMWTGSHGPIGGVMQLPKEAQDMGAPSHWLPYFAVANVDETVDRAKGHGAKVYVPPTDIPTVGRFSVLGDPQGATFAVFTASAEWTGTDEPYPGTFSWHELMTTDREKAFDFYSDLLGWEKTGAFDMGGEVGTYQMFGRAGAPATANGPSMLGGMMNISSETPTPTAWILYVMVDDADASVERVKEMGGQILYGPMDVPGGDRVATAIDPQGAVFGMHARKQG